MYHSIESPCCPVACTDLSWHDLLNRLLHSHATNIYVQRSFSLLSLTFHLRRCCGVSMLSRRKNHTYLRRLSLLKTFINEVYYGINCLVAYRIPIKRYSLTTVLGLIYLFVNPQTISFMIVMTHTESYRLNKKHHTTHKQSPLYRCIWADKTVPHVESNGQCIALLYTWIMVTELYSRPLGAMWSVILDINETHRK